MTPAQHRTAAADGLAVTTPSPVEEGLHVGRAEVHAILAGKAGTGTSYAAAEQHLDDSLNPNAPRQVHIARARVNALLAD